MVIYPVDGVVSLLIKNWGCVHAISVDELFVCKKEKNALFNWKLRMSFFTMRTVSSLDQ